MKISHLFTALSLTSALLPSISASIVADYHLNELSAPAIDTTGLTGHARQAGSLLFGQPSVPAGLYGSLTVSPETAASFGTAIDFTAPGIGNLVFNDPTLINNLIAPDGSGRFTIMAWFNTEAATGYQTIFSSGTGNTGFKFLINGDDIGFTAHAVLDVSADVSITANTWFHGAMTYSDRTVEFFLNGESVGSASVPGYIDEAANFEAKIGGRFGGFDNFNGLIDEVKIADAVLTRAEIHAATVPEPTSACLLLGSATLLFRRNRRG